MVEAEGFTTAMTWAVVLEAEASAATVGRAVVTEVERPAVVAGGEAVFAEVLRAAEAAEHVVVTCCFTHVELLHCIADMSTIYRRSTAGKPAGQSTVRAARGHTRPTSALSTARCRVATWPQPNLARRRS
ncbi:hypothetical protein VSH64_04375 [Amycolatopsis rhabdoformis]|uniref:Uncharacterized protein n=1 Tax=Amycolatopsis rhabdoformis TaxID=1448059 RepID=A0ABZ1ID41_9PSEU|nr:hypothetical protein [Amycolatopsis rhabdoformis]WSE31345.1 hypothetical protein VSH64_04375 [Amycolatopsis rhabdoformis]